MSDKKQVTPPVPLNRLKQIANDACQSAIGSVEFYDHAKTAQWNQSIINNMLRAVISESTPDKAAAPAFKFAINSTIVQHLVPTSQLNKAKGTSTGTSTEEAQDAAASSDPASTATATDGKPHVGRRGMHSATGAYWNEETDGMWSYKYDGGEAKGMDVVIMLIWIAL
ncbi:Dynein light chain Tctex-type [Cytospora mali]|uniref:Dynein light chain Tctex-type n=1 Tax=Cytospora mali TaxID=578113 RepID=A0A194W9I5_CYTMA|nr:Dynein light chain Tctex-type [Valsa mali]